MNNPLKKGVLAGLIAGILAGMVFSVSIYVAASLGFFLSFWRSLIANGYAATIPLGTIFGVILGIIYYEFWVAPHNWSIAMDLAYAWLGVGFAQVIVFGLVLGYLYKKE
jgi:hypothetical protein